jgi:hypothetical protein
LSFLPPCSFFFFFFFTVTVPLLAGAYCHSLDFQNIESRYYIFLWHFLSLFSFRPAFSVTYCVEFTPSMFHFFSLLLLLFWKWPP